MTRVLKRYGPRRVSVSAHGYKLQLPKRALRYLNINRDIQDYDATWYIQEDCVSENGDVRLIVVLRKRPAAAGPNTVSPQ